MDLRLGAESDSGPELFADIRDVAVTRNGRIHVANNGTAQVRVFDSLGKFVTEFGRRGQGPGEFRMLNELWTIEDSTVIIDWQGGGRGSLFDAQGSHVASWTSTRPDGSLAFVVARTSNGWLARTYAYPAPPHEKNVAIRPRLGFSVLDNSASATTREGWERESTTRLFASSGEGGLDWPLFEPMIEDPITPSGMQFVVANPLEYKIEVRDINNQLLRTVTHEYTPYVITRDEVQQMHELIERHYELRPPPGPGWQTVKDAKARIDARAARPIVATQSPFGRLLASEEGELWVERPDLTRAPARIAYETMYSPDVRMPGMEELPTIWDRFDPQGRFIGAVRLPARFTAHAILHGRVYGVLLGDNDVQFVVRYRPTPDLER